MTDAKKYTFLVAVGMVMAVAVCSLQAAAQQLPADRFATRETVNLYNHLQRLLSRGIMFGHQDDLAYGVGWKYQEGRSDIRDVSGDYPAVYGWELGRVEIDHPVNLDSVPFDWMRRMIRKAYDRGAVITISWHLNNPMTGRSAWDPETGTVASILPGGSHHEVYRSWLDKIAIFLQSLKGARGEMIPVIFRPFHEWNGDWFWWGGKHCTPAEFRALWKFTVAYLRDTKKIHHLLYAFNSDRFSLPADYLSKYPGDEWVDILGFDIYQRSQPNDRFMSDADTMLTYLESMAKQHNKIPALTEFGGNMADSSWWTSTFLPLLSRHRISYVLAWRNAGAKQNGEFEFYVPYRGQGTARDFRQFSRSKNMLFQKSITRQKIYQ